MRVKEETALLLVYTVSQPHPLTVVHACCPLARQDLRSVVLDEPSKIAGSCDLCHNTVRTRSRTWLPPVLIAGLHSAHPQHHTANSDTQPRAPGRFSQSPTIIAGGRHAAGVAANGLRRAGWSSTSQKPRSSLQLGRSFHRPQNRPEPANTGRGRGSHPTVTPGAPRSTG